MSYRRRRGFSLLETMLALTMLSGMVLVVMLAALNMPRSAQPVRLQRASNLARSAIERMRSLPLDSDPWLPGQVVEDSDPELEVILRVTEPEARFRLLEVQVRRREQGTSLVRMSLLRTEGGP
ncbi:MAG: type IV pilus modification PilV family protein [Candidatus Xenobium sp.]|nr:type II secretion system protein [Burkholderiales bacterium]